MDLTENLEEVLHKSPTLASLPRVTEGNLIPGKLVFDVEFSQLGVTYCKTETEGCLAIQKGWSGRYHPLNTHVTPRRFLPIIKKICEELNA